MKNLKDIIQEKLIINKDTDTTYHRNEDFKRYGDGDWEEWDFFKIKDSLPWHKYPSVEKIDYNKTNSFLEKNIFKANEYVYHIKDENLKFINSGKTGTIIKKDLDLAKVKILTQVPLNKYDHFIFYKNVLNGLNIAILAYYDEHYKYKTDIYINSKS